MAERMGCDEARELIPELAAGVAAGDERASVLGHLGGCPECRRELAGTAEVVDELLLLAPGHEPPAGFESSVLARMLPAVPRRRRRWRGLLAAASIVVAAALAGGAVWWQTVDDRQLARDYRDTLAIAHGSGLRAAPLRAGGAELGTVFAYQGSPSWVYVTFRSAPPEGRYDVRLLSRDGRRLTLRPFTPAPRGAAWGSTIEVPIEQIRTIEFVRAGVPVMTASFG